MHATGLNILPLVLGWVLDRLYKYVQIKTIFWSKYNINPNGTRPPEEPVFVEATEAEPEPTPAPNRPWETSQYAWDYHGYAAGDYVVDDNDANFTAKTDTETDSDTETDPNEDETNGLAKGSLLAEQPGGVIRAQTLLQRACDDGYETCPHCSQVISIFSSGSYNWRLNPCLICSITTQIC